MRRYLGVALLLFLSTLAFGRQRVFGNCEQGGSAVTVSGISSTQKVQTSYPFCTVTVYLAGTLTKPSQIYSDNASTPLSNPFTANADGSWVFYPDDGHYDVALSGAGIPLPFTRGDMIALDTGSRFYSGQQFVFAGDSIFGGQGLSAGQDIPSQTMLLDSFTGRGTKTNAAVTGYKIADLVTQYAGTVYPLRPAGSGSVRSYLFVLIGINDIGIGSNGNTVGNSIVSYLTTAKADGFTVVAFLQYATINNSATQIAQLHNMNTVLRQSPSAWNYLIDLETPVRTTSDLTMFQGDGTHPAAKGAIAIAKIINGVMFTEQGFADISMAYNYATGLGETVGIGTQSPLNTLDIWCPSSNLTLVTNEGCAAVTNSDPTVGNLSALLFRNRSASTSVPIARIAAEATASGATLHLQTSNNYATGITTDGLLLDKNGNLGIGLQPTQKLDVNGNTRMLGTLNVSTSITLNGGTAITGQSGTGGIVAMTATPTFTTPVLGAATGTSLALGGGTALATTNQTGTGSLVLQASPTLTTPNIGAATGTSLNLSGALTVGGGTAVTKILSTTAVLDFANQAAIGCNDLSVTVTGAALGDVVALGVPNASVPNSNVIYWAWVQSANTVFVRYCNLTSGDPASGTFRVDVIQH